MKAFYTFLLSMVVLLPQMGAQEITYSQSSESDPDAVILLERMEALMDQQDVIRVDFEMRMTFPGEPAHDYTGKFEQQDLQYKVDVGTYQIYSDGITRWVYVEEINEVNIYNSDPEDGPQTPLDHLQLYKNEEFVFAITGEDVIDGDVAKIIEFKPLDKYSDFAKVRLTIRERDAHPVSVEMFEKGGSRVALRIFGIEEAQKFPAGYFKFTIADYPGVRVEDLRID